MIEESVEIEPLYNDRAVRLEFANERQVTFRVINMNEVKRAEQIAHLSKENLLDALAQIGWLPDEYRKPEPLDPRESKIQAAALAIYNDDAQRYKWTLHDTYEAFARHEADWRVADYRNNAEALINAGLVTVDE